MVPRGPSACKWIRIADCGEEGRKEAAFFARPRLAHGSTRAMKAQGESKQASKPTRVQNFLDFEHAFRRNPAPPWKQMYQQQHAVEQFQTHNTPRLSPLSLAASFSAWSWKTRNLLNERAIQTCSALTLSLSPPPTDAPIAFFRPVEKLKPSRQHELHTALRLVRNKGLYIAARSSKLLSALWRTRNKSTSRHKPRTRWRRSQRPRGPRS